MLSEEKIIKDTCVNDKICN